MISIQLLMTEECSFNCEYCLLPNKQNRKSVTIEILKQYDWLFNYINKLQKTAKKFVLCFAGGELGYLDEEVLDYIFSKVDYKVIVSCQEEFMEKGYQKKYSEKINDIHFHAADLTSTKKVKKYKEFGTNILYGIVDNDISKIVEFLKYNNHIDFDYVDIETPLKYNLKENEIQEKLELLYNSIKGLNVKETELNRLKSKVEKVKILGFLKNKKDMCYKTYDINLDLVNGKIFKCFRDINDSIDLTKENFNKYLLKSPFSKTSICESCSRLFINIEGISIQERLQMKKILGSNEG